MIPILFLYIAINIIIAWWNNKIRLKAIQQGNPIAIKHGWWAVFYTALCFIPFIWYRNWWQVCSLLPLHLSVFPVAFNLFCKLPPFHLSKTSTAKSDQLMVRLGLTSTEAVNLACLCLSILFLVFQFIL